MVAGAVILLAGRCSPGLNDRCNPKPGPVQRTPDFDRPGGEGQTRRRYKFKAMATAAEPSMLEVFAIAIGQGASDQDAIRINIQTDRRFGMVCVLRPAGDAGLPDMIDRAAQFADTRSVVRLGKSCTLRQASPYGFDFVAVIAPRRAITCRLPDIIGIKPVIFVRVVKHAAAVIVEEGFR